MAISGMRPGAAASKAAAVASFAVVLGGCAGLLDSALEAPTPDAGGKRVDAVLGRRRAGELRTAPWFRTSTARSTRGTRAPAPP